MAHHVSPLAHDTLPFPRPRWKKVRAARMIATTVARTTYTVISVILAAACASRRNTRHCLHAVYKLRDRIKK